MQVINIEADERLLIFYVLCNILLVVNSGVDGFIITPIAPIIVISNLI